MKNRYLAFLSLSIVFLISSCIKDKSETEVELIDCPDVVVEAGDYNDQLAYEIIDIVLFDNFETRDFIHVMEASESSMIWINSEDLKEYLNLTDVELEDQHIEEYLALNSASSKWKAGFTEGTLMSQEERDCIFSNRQFTCESYESKYPNASGFLTFTKPALYQDNLVILEYFQSACNSARGEFIVLELVDDIWTIKHQFTTIIS